MHISWFGLSSFKLTSRDVTLITDPFSKSSGLTPPRGAAQILVSSAPDNDLCNNFSSISDNPFLIDSPGEYDVKGVFIRGLPISVKKPEGSKPPLDKRAVFSFNMEGLLIGFLGQYPEKILLEEHIEEMDGIDILLVPVGGGNSCDAEAAVGIINQIEPKIVIPMQYKIPGCVVKLDPVDRFLKEMGGKGEEMDKLLVKKNDLEEEKTRIIILNPQR